MSSLTGILTFAVGRIFTFDDYPATMYRSAISARFHIALATSSPSTIAGVGVT